MVAEAMIEKSSFVFEGVEVVMVGGAVVIERAVETVASMWSSGPSSTVANGGKGYTENTVSKGLKLEAKA